MRTEGKEGERRKNDGLGMMMIRRPHARPVAPGSSCLNVGVRVGRGGEKLW